jgi:hypothetical protein
MVRERENFGKWERVRTPLGCVARERKKKMMVKERNSLNMKERESFNVKEKEFQC